MTLEFNDSIGGALIKRIFFFFFFFFFRNIVSSVMGAPYEPNINDLQMTGRFFRSVISRHAVIDLAQIPLIYLYSPQKPSNPDA